MQTDFSELCKALTGRQIATEAELSARATSFPQISGIYFLLRGGRVVYVGQSINIMARVAEHSASEKRGRWDAWAWMPCETSLLDLVESLYIHHYTPELNGRGRKSSGGAGALFAPMRPETIAALANDNGRASKAC